MRVTALVPYPENRVPGQRFRIEQWVPWLQEQGIDVELVPFLTPETMGILYERGYWLRKVSATLLGYLRRYRRIVRGGRCDVVYLYREAAPLGVTFLERALARRYPVVFDFDDAIYLGDVSRANAVVRVLKARSKTDRICGLATHVTVGNGELASYARRHNANVTVVPTSIDTETYQPRSHAESMRPVVGWSGSVTTLPHIEFLAPALRRLRARIDFELHVIGGQLQLPDVDVQCHAWRADEEVERIGRFDVGIMPLPDDEWARGKCGLKALQYMAMGVPTVVSPVGVNARIVTDGEDGFHARNGNEWVARVERLLRDSALRRQMGARARRTVEERYSARVVAPQMARVLRAAAGIG